MSEQCVCEGVSVCVRVSVCVSVCVRVSVCECVCEVCRTNCIAFFCCSVTKAFVVTKGNQFTTTVEKPETDLTPEMIQT